MVLLSLAFVSSQLISGVTSSYISPSPSSSPVVLKIRSSKPAAEGFFGASNYFYASSRSSYLGRNSVIELSGSRIAVIDPFFDGEKGAVHVYNLNSGVRLASFTGVNAGNRFGSGGVFKLSNGNFLISSPFDDDAVTNRLDSGSLTLVDQGTLKVLVTVRGDAAGDHLSGMNNTVSPMRDYVLVGPSDVIAVASPRAKGTKGLVQLRRGIDLGVLKSFEGEAAGDLYGSGGLTRLTVNNGFAVGSPEMYKQNNKCLKCGQVAVISFASQAVTSVVPAITTTYWELFTSFTSNFRLGSGDIVEMPDGSLVLGNESDASGKIKNGCLVFLNVPKRPIGIYSKYPVPAANQANNTVVTTCGTDSNSFYSMGNTPSGEGGIISIPGTSKFILSNPRNFYAGRANAGALWLHNVVWPATGPLNLTTATLGSTTLGGLADDYFGRTILLLKNSNFAVLSGHADSVYQDGTIVRDSGMVSLYNSTTVNPPLGFFWGATTDVGRKAGMGGGLALSASEFVADKGREISFASTTDLSERRKISITAQINTGDPRASAFAMMPDEKMFVVMSARISDAVRPGNGTLFLVDVASRSVIQSISHDALSVNLGHAGVRVLSTGHILLFNPSDSSNGIANSGSIWIVKF